MITLRKLRQEKNITMKQLGECLGFAESTISLYENGKREPDNNTLVKLAKFFDVSIDYLLGRTDFSPSHNVSICHAISNLIDTFKIPPNKDNIIGIDLIFPQIKKGEYLFTHEVVEQISAYFGVSKDSILNFSENPSSGYEELTQKEKQLIQDYRSLSNQGKEYILQTMDMAKGVYKKDTDVSGVEIVG